MKTYVIAAICIGMFLAYQAGGRIAREQCRADASVQNVIDANKTIETKRKINEKVFNTNGDDIRNRLREKYTIKD